MKNKKFLSRISFILSAVIVVVLLQSFTSNAVKRKEADYRFRPFYKYSSEYDVLFFGNSHVINGIYCMELWKDYGIASYNMGGHANQMASTYWQLVCALESSKPELVVVDCSYISHDWRLMADDIKLQHESWDLIPLGPTKTKAAWDITAFDTGSKEEQKKQVMEILYPYSIYHNRWTSLGDDDLSDEESGVNLPKDFNSHNKEKGSELRIDHSYPDDHALESYDGFIEGEPQGLYYLRKILEHCKKNNQKILLTFLPFPAHEDDWQEINTAGRLAKEYKVPYLNFFDLNLVDFETDLYDETSHLNPSGARKVTDYMGQYLRSNLSIPDRRGEAAYAHWEDDYKEYQELKISYMKVTEDRSIMLLQLYKAHMGIVVDVKDESVYDNELNAKLLGNLGIAPGTMGKSYIYGATKNSKLETVYEHKKMTVAVAR